MIRDIKRTLKKSPAWRIVDLLRGVEKKFNKVREEFNQKKAYSILEQEGYNNITFLGAGKDGSVYKVEKDNTKKVVKFLSKYGRRYLPITEAVIEKKIKTPLIYDVKVNGNFIEYNYEKLEHRENSVPALLNMYIDICKLQRILLDNNLIYWDLGFSSFNFMYTKGGQLRLIDYGGNGFLFVKDVEASVKSSRKMLVKANNEFLQNILLTHLITFGIGKKKFKRWASTLQHGNVRFPEFVNLAEKLLNGTSFQTLKDCILQQDFLTKEGWTHFEEMLNSLVATNKKWTLETADIDEVVIEKERVEVRGYQNYDLTPFKIEALNIGHSWTLSRKKFQLINNTLKKIQGETFLDIGCNLGMYVFLARIEHQLKSTGLDYNKAYIQQCNQIDKVLGLGCKFKTQSFSDIGDTFDIVSCLGLIHHLYQRTESYNGLGQILSVLRDITKKYLIVEFPTEHDPKSNEWIDFDANGTDREYSLRKFLEVSRKKYQRVTYLGSVTDNRPIYLLEC